MGRYPGSVRYAVRHSRSRIQKQRREHLTSVER